ADGGVRPAGEDAGAGLAVVAGLPQPARRGGDVLDARVALDDGDRGDAAAHRGGSEGAGDEPGERVGRGGWGGGDGGEAGEGDGKAVGHVGVQGVAKRPGEGASL